MSGIEIGAPGNERPGSWAGLRRAAVLAALAVPLALIAGALWFDGIDRPDAGPAALQAATDPLPRSAEAMDLLAAARAAPGDVALSQRAARALIADARRTDDPQLTEAAIAVLRAPGATYNAESLYLEAVATQYQHRYAASFALLDQAIGLDAGHVNAILTRATLQIVQGRLSDAAADCRRLAALGRQDVALLCQSTAMILTPRAAEVDARLAAILARPGMLDPALTGWATGLRAEIALARGDDAAARGFLAQVIAADPLALRERLMLADLLLRQGEAAAVPDLLAPAPPSDAVLIRRILAARDMGETALADGLARVLHDRIRVALAMGSIAHAREEGQYFLLIADDPQAALARAEANWTIQRELDDARLLVEAAVAAGQPGSAGPVAEWMAMEGVRIPGLELPGTVDPAG